MEVSCKYGLGMKELFDDLCIRTLAVRTAPEAPPEEIQRIKKLTDREAAYKEAMRRKRLGEKDETPEEPSSNEALYEDYDNMRTEEDRKRKRYAGQRPRKMN